MAFNVPGEPVAKERPRFNLKTGKVYTPHNTRAQEDAIALMARATGIKFGSDRVVVLLIFHTKNDTSDLDNYVKCVLDGINKSGVWNDDKQVDVIHAYRVNDAEAQTEVIVQTIVDTDETKVRVLRSARDSTRLGDLPNPPGAA